MIKDQDYEALCPYLLWIPIDHIKQTLATTSQWFCCAYHIPFHNHFKSCFPDTITEKIKHSQQGHNWQHNVRNSSFLGSLLVLLVEL